MHILDIRTCAKPAARFFAAVLAILLIASPAHAVFLEADQIDADGSFSTVDLWFFSFDLASTATIQVNDLGGPPVVGSDPDMVIYVDDGTFANVFGSDIAGGADPAITDLFPAGSYVAAVANHPLAIGQFGPVHADPALAVGGYDYEFNGPEPVGGTISINCLLSGSLGGGYTKRVFAQDTCRLPPASVPAPSALGLLGFGLAGLGLRRRRPQPSSKPTDLSKEDLPHQTDERCRLT